MNADNTRVHAARVPVVALALGLCGLPDDARAEVPCDTIDHWTRLVPLNPYMVPTDGILLVSVRGYDGTEGSDDDALARLTVTVTLDDVPITGAIETTDVAGTIAWRPDGALMPGGYYVVHAVLNNSAESDAAACAPDLLDSLFTMIVEHEPTTPLTPPTLSTDSRVRELLFQGLDSLACCDGARPIDPPDLGSASGQVYWKAGHCASIRGWTYLDVSVDVEHGLPPASAGVVALRFVEDGEPGPFTQELDERQWFARERPFCQRVELKNMATGATVSSEEVCHGQGVAGLGTHEVDATAELEEHCRGAAQTCEIVEAVEVGQTVSTWDLDRCVPWPGETDGSNTGSGCMINPHGAGWIVLLALCRRRRRP